MSNLPITPDQVIEAKSQGLPPFVIRVFDELIIRKWNGTQSKVLAKEAVAMMRELSDEDPYTRRWLDIEDTYRSVGWNVEYDRPGFNEDYDAFYVFTKGSKKHG